MENFYKKYSKPIVPLTYENVIVHLENYTNILKEYLESLIFINNELKSDFINYKNSDKKEIFPLIENFKNKILIILEKIQNFLTEKYNLNKKEINNKEFSNIELIRENFNSILLNLTQFFIDFDFLEKIHKKFINLNKKIHIQSKTNFDIVDETKNNLKNIKPFFNILNSVKTNNELINISNQKLLKKFDSNYKNNKKISQKFSNENCKNSCVFNKKNYNENFELKNEINHMKNQINDLNFKYKKLQENFDSLKNENISLKKQNFYLIEYINKNKIKK